MRFISNSSLADYAILFWRRERQKPITDKNRKAFGELGTRVDPIDVLCRYYSDKLPFEGKRPCHVKIFELTREDVEALRIHDRIIDPRDKSSSEWLRDRNLVPDPPSTELEVLAKTFRDRGYFEKYFNNKVEYDRSTQLKKYKAWTERNSLENVLMDEMPCIQHNLGEEHEIVDGWGRLLPYVTLVQEGMEFFPILCYVATSC